MSGGGQGQGSTGGLGQTQGQLYNSFGFGQGQRLNANTQPSYGGFGGGYGQPSYGGFGGGYNQPSYGGYGQNYNAYAPNFGGSFYNQGPTYQAPMYQTQSAQTTQPQQIGSFQNATASQLQGFVNQPNWSYDDTTGMYVNPLTGTEANSQPVQPANMVSQQDYTRAYRPSNQYQGQLNPNQYYQPIYQQQYQNYYSPYYSQMGAGNNMGMYNTMAQYGYNPYSSFDPYTNSFGGQGYGIDSILQALAPYFSQGQQTAPAQQTTTNDATSKQLTALQESINKLTTDKLAADKTAGTANVTPADKGTMGPNTQYISDGKGGYIPVNMNLTGNTNSTAAGYLADKDFSAADKTAINDLLGTSTDEGKAAIYNTLNQFGVDKNALAGTTTTTAPAATGITSVAPTTTAPVTSTKTSPSGDTGWYWDDSIDGWTNLYTGAQTTNTPTPSVAPATSNPVASGWSFDDSTDGWVNNFTGAWSATGPKGAKQGGLMSLLRKK